MATFETDYKKGNTPVNELGRMIDPFIIKHDECYYLFFKQNGINCSVSRDLKTWEYTGNTAGGENACVIKREDEFILVHSPGNGISFSKSKDLISWEDFGFTTLNQGEWEWVSGRLTAGFVLEAPPDFEYRYILFFHGSADVYPETHGNASLAVAFTNDFKQFCYEL